MSLDVAAVCHMTEIHTTCCVHSHSESQLSTSCCVVLMVLMVAHTKPVSTVCVMLLVHDVHDAST